MKLAKSYFFYQSNHSDHYFIKRPRIYRHTWLMRHISTSSFAATRTRTPKCDEEVAIARSVAVPKNTTGHTMVPLVVGVVLSSNDDLII